ncbi:hypothetical protein [Kocuria rosea]|uniref:hypothetical protein n=1 Tax=Kocuria rosea TaxID=1275 RepID=UPI003D32868F
MTRRITITAGLARYTESATRDAHGNHQPGWVEPVPIGLYALAPKTSVEPDESGRRAVLTGMTAYAPLGTLVGAHDRLVLPDGTTWEVVGEVGQWAGNPHGGLLPGHLRPEGVQFDIERSTG